MFFLGIDLGSSAVKAAVLDATTGQVVTSAQYPTEEMPIESPRPGWAEQDPEMWWRNAVTAVKMALRTLDGRQVKAVGISYQMHGLVAVDAKQRPVRPAIIWCDSRAVELGEHAFEAIGRERCLQHMLNSPGNFTAAKLRWVQENEPDVYARIAKVMLPGDYLAMRLTGCMQTTVSGLAEGILWDFAGNSVSRMLLEHWGIDPDLICQTVPTFGVQAEVSKQAADELSIPVGVPVAYRAGDQPNNAFSLKVMQPGDMAATGGTSGVIYGVSDRLAYDPEGRVNSFAHVNHSAENPRIGILLCINGAGILYAWLRRMLGGAHTYAELNAMASQVAAGSKGLAVLPFGNGSERMLGNRQIGAHFIGLDFLHHESAHLVRAAQEGVAFAFCHGVSGMKAAGLEPMRLRAGNANLFLSPVFRSTLAATLGVGIELYNTDGAAGAARGAGLGSGLFGSDEDAFKGLVVREVIEPDPHLQAPCQEAFARWEAALNEIIGK